MLPIFVSCSPDSEVYVKTTEYVHITELTIPDTAELLDTVAIEARAEENNECWKDLNFSFETLSDTSYGLAAYGTFESHGNCTEKVVAIDTAISIYLSREGKYYFYIRRDPSTIELDSLLVIDTLNN
jgi:hypothetical protein